MAEKNSSMKVPEFLREPLEAAQSRLAEFEEEAQRVFKELMAKGKESRKEVSVLVQRLSRQDWNMHDLKGRVTKLRAQGMERAYELKGRAESFRSEAIEKLEDLQTKAVAFLGVATREQVEELSREIERLAKRIDRSDRPRKAKKAAKRSAAAGE